MKSLPLDVAWRLRFCGFGRNESALCFDVVEGISQHYADEDTNKMESCNMAECGVVEGSDGGEGNGISGGCEMKREGHLDYITERS